MRKRALQVRFVKDNKDSATEEAVNNDDFQEKLAIASVFSKDIVNDVLKAAAAYVVLDTARKVIIARATK